MSGNPRLVASDITFTWDGVEQRLQRGTVLDVPAGSALEKALGPENLVPFGGLVAQPAPEAAEEAHAAPAAAKATAPQPPARSGRGVPQDTAKDSSDEKEGHS